MLSDSEKAVLGDIRYFIDLIGSFLEGYDYQRFAGDLRTFHAITRCLEIISETLRRGIPRSSGGRWPPPATSIATSMKMWRSRSFGRPFTTPCLPPSRAIINVELAPYE